MRHHGVPCSDASACCDVAFLNARRGVNDPCPCERSWSARTAQLVAEGQPVEAARLNAFVEQVVEWRGERRPDRRAGQLAWSL